MATVWAADQNAAADRTHDVERRDANQRGLRFCDVSSFYAPTGGGIRTYHDAKIEWFGSQARHAYVLIHPGPHDETCRLAPTVTRVAVRGTRARGYHLPL